MSLEIHLLELPDQSTLIMKITTPVDKLPEFLGHAYGEIMGYLSETGKTPAGMPFCTYYNLDMSALVVEAGFPVSEKITGKNEIIAGIIPAGKYISTVFSGPYDAIQPAYDALTHWAEENDHELDGIAYEYYLNDPRENPSIEPMTELRFRLK